MPDKDDPDAESLPETVEATAGIQGGEGNGSLPQAFSPTLPADVPDLPSPDAAEIEWAGTVIKKPPHPVQ